MRKALAGSFVVTAACAATTGDPDAPLAVDAAPPSTPTAQAAAPRCRTLPAPDLAGLPDADPLAAVFALEFPRGLDFGEPHRDASVQRFNAFVADLQQRGAAATSHYQARGAAATDAATKREAIERLEQTYRYMGELLATAEIPVDVRTGADAAAKTTAFCDKLAAVAGPLLARADDAAQALRASAAAPSP